MIQLLPLNCFPFPVVHEQSGNKRRNKKDQEKKIVGQPWRMANVKSFDRINILISKFLIVYLPSVLFVFFMASLFCAFLFKLRRNQTVIKFYKLCLPKIPGRVNSKAWKNKNQRKSSPALEPVNYEFRILIKDVFQITRNAAKLWRRETGNI